MSRSASKTTGTRCRVSGTGRRLGACQPPSGCQTYSASSTRCPRTTYSGRIVPAHAPDSPATRARRGRRCSTRRARTRCRRRRTPRGRGRLPACPAGGRQASPSLSAVLSWAYLAPPQRRMKHDTIDPLHPQIRQAHPNALAYLLPDRGVLVVRDRAGQVLPVKTGELGLQPHVVARDEFLGKGTLEALADEVFLVVLVWGRLVSGEGRGEGEGRAYLRLTRGVDAPEALLQREVH